MTVAAIKKNVREFLSEPGPNGTLSWGRVMSTVTVLTSIIWVTKYFLVTHTLPTMTDVAAFAVAPYATNKAITAAQSFGPNPVNPTPDAPTPHPDQKES